MTERIRPVELLRDNKGIYGIGFNEGYPFDQPPFADNICGYILPERALILRPDVIAENVNIPCLPAASLQMLPRGWRGGMEGALCDVISHVIMHRCGVLERPGDVGLSKEARAKFLRKYHGTHRIAGKIVNRLIYQVLEQAPDPMHSERPGDFISATGRPCIVKSPPTLARCN